MILQSHGSRLSNYASASSRLSYSNDVPLMCRITLIRTLEAGSNRDLAEWPRHRPSLCVCTAVVWLYRHPSIPEDHTSSHHPLYITHVGAWRKTIKLGQQNSKYFLVYAYIKAQSFESFTLFGKNKPKFSVFLFCGLQPEKLAAGADSLGWPRLDTSK